MKDKLIFPLVGILCATLLILPVMLLGYNLGKDAVSYAELSGTVEVEETGNRAGEAVDTPAPLNTGAGQVGAITIPGFEQVRLSASPAPQTTPFYNPGGNPCYFVISLILPSREEIYRSALIAPGEAAETAALSLIPQAGIYENAVLRYTCYSLEGYEAMNGAGVDITLEIV